jgi:hypothetical protein
MATIARSGCRRASMDPDSYEPHRLHQDGRTYRETNCYADVLIELLHARGAEPLAAFGFIARTEWEGDQFTYSKPPHGDLERLFGVDVHEMLPYRPIPEHIEQQLSLGRTVLVEIDAWYLPDTEGTSYRRGHLKTTIAPESIDRAQERLVYFHNGGVWELSGEDYRGAFRMLDRFTDDVMDPFIEVVRFDAGTPLEGEDLRDAARTLLIGHFKRRPDANPFRGWAERLPQDLARLRDGDPSAVHEYAFVTVRMVGSAFELFADHLEWVLGDDGRSAAAAFRVIPERSVALSIRLARRRPFDIEAALAPLIEAWELGMTELGRSLQGWS